MKSPRPMTLEDVLSFPPLSAWRAGVTDPDLSPDGRQVAYAYDGQIWLIDTEGGEPRRLTEGAAPRWSPVREEIAFVRGQPARLWIRDAGGGERQMAPSGPGLALPMFVFRGTLAFAWSPDGPRIAMVGPLEEPAGDGGKEPLASW